MKKKSRLFHENIEINIEMSIKKTEEKKWKERMNRNQSPYSANFSALSKKKMLSIVYGINITLFIDFSTYY